MYNSKIAEKEARAYKLYAKLLDSACNNNQCELCVKSLTCNYLYNNLNPRIK